VALGIILIFLFRHRLIMNIFPFPVSTAKLVGVFYNNKMVVCTLTILTFSLCSANTIGLAIRAPPIGKAQQT
jgi:hypothetical protein